MVADVIREALALYRRLGLALAAVTALCFLPLAAAVLALGLAVPRSQQAEIGLAIVDAAGSVLLCTPLASLVAIRTAAACERDGAAGVARHIGGAFGDLPAYVLTQLLVLAVIAALPGALIAAGYAAGSPAVVFFGALLLLVSALVNGVRLAVATVAVAVGDARFGPALRRSAALSRGRWLVVLGTLLATGALALAVSFAVSAITAPVPAGIAADVASAVADVVANAVAVPFVALASYRLYRLLNARPA